MKALFFFIMLLSSFWSNAQLPLKDWKQAELFVKGRSINSAKELRAFGKEIKEKFQDELTRLQVVYLWVIGNISYDCIGLKSKTSRWALDSVLESKKAVCAGYVNVFRNLCDAAAVECIDIQGYGRSGYDDLIVRNDSFAMNHTWNAVKIGGSWNLVDVTWASGFTSEDCRSFTRHRNDWYFCTDPRKFIWDHYPKDPDWQLVGHSVDWASFRNYPLLFPGVVENDLKDFYPRTASLNRAVGDTIQFHFSTDKLYNRIIVSSRKRPEIYRMDEINAQKEGYSYLYKIEKKGAYDLQIDLLHIENPRPLHSYQVKSYTDIVYWLNVMPR